MAVSLAEQSCYTLINPPSDAEQPSEMQLKDGLEKGDPKAKGDTLKKLIYMILNGEKVLQQHKNTTNITKHHFKFLGTTLFNLL